MPTLNQIIRKKCRKPKHRKQTRKPCFMRGICLSATSMAPKKPNSASRKIAKCKVLYTYKEKRNNGNFISRKKTRMFIAKIGGEKHNIREHSILILKWQRAMDCPGVLVSVVRGLKDAGPVQGRKNRRSLYGVKSTKKK